MRILFRLHYDFLKGCPKKMKAFCENIEYIPLQHVNLCL